MDLETYLFKNRMTRIAFAKKIGVNPGYISHVIHGRYYFSKKLSSYIEEVTKGEVTFEELRKDVPARKKRTSK